MGTRESPRKQASNASSGSTTWAWRRVKLNRAPQARGSASAASTFWFRLSERNPREPLKVTLKLRGGAECWVEVHARGGVGRYHGATALYDVLADINNLRR